MLQTTKDCIQERIATYKAFEDEKAVRCYGLWEAAIEATETQALEGSERFAEARAIMILKMPGELIDKTILDAELTHLDRIYHQKREEIRKADRSIGNDLSAKILNEKKEKKS